MKKLFTIGALAIALVLMAFAPEEKYETLSIGDQLPMADHPMLDVSNDKTTIAENKKENGTLVIFSCNTCPFVVAWEDRYDDITQVANRMNIGIVLLNSNEAKRDGDDSFEAMRAHAAENKYMMPYLVDENSEVANAFGAKTTPHVFLFDKNDKLVYKGAIDDNFEDRSKIEHAYLQDAMRDVYEGKEVAVPETDAKGCSIKRVK